jgi:hypothetical protein
MTRRAARLVVVVVAVFALQQPAAGYLKFGFRIGDRTVDVKWGQQPVRYFVTERDVAGVTAADFRAAVARAATTWQGAEGAQIAFEFMGTTGAPPGIIDGRTTLGFLDRPDLDRVLGATSLLLDSTTGSIIEADVFFNTRFPWSVAPAGDTGRVDLESVVLHELGHLIGLGHSALGETERTSAGTRRVIASGAVMFPIAMSPGTIADRVLQPDDKAGVADIYPAGNRAGSAGSVQGRVTKNGQGVYGAHVVAFNPATGALIGGFTLSANGEFVIAGLDPGPHVLRVEPLDDGEVESFITGPVDVDFVATYGPRMVVAPAGGSSAPIEIAVSGK